MTDSGPDHESHHTCSARSVVVRKSTDGGIVRPRAFAVFRLIIRFTTCHAGSWSARQRRRAAAASDDLARHGTADLSSPGTPEPAAARRVASLRSLVPQFHQSRSRLVVEVGLSARRANFGGDILDHGRRSAAGQRRGRGPWPRRPGLAKRAHHLSYAARPAFRDSARSACRDRSERRLRVRSLCPRS